MLYRYKVGIFAGFVTGVTFLLAYITGPSLPRVPTIRVLHVSFSDYSLVKQSLGFVSSVHQHFEEVLNVLPVSINDSLTIDMDELGLKRGEIDEFYQDNILLECTSSFPVTWKYSGFGGPAVTEKNVRIHGNFNDSSTFLYLSLLNLMPLTESSTGTYTCFGASNETYQLSASVHLFVPGTTTFVINYDTSVEAAGENQIFVPCPVTNASANISLYFKNQLVSTENADNILSFNPKSGFYLKPKFAEEQTDPWGQFYCKNEETNEKSGVITILPQKSLVVNAVPESNTVFISSPNSKRSSPSSRSTEEMFTFLCQAKEEVTLKFLRVVSNPMVFYDYNSSVTFPFSAYTEVGAKNLKNLSKIYCRTVRNNEDLHSWKVLFSDLEGTGLMEFNYDPSREDFFCCSPSNKRAKLTLLNCNSLSECIIKGQCFLPGRKCDPEIVTSFPERTGCARYKLQQQNDNSNNNNEPNDNSLSLESGLIQCSIDSISGVRLFLMSRETTENGSQLNIVSGEISLTSSTRTTSFRLDSSSIQGSSYLHVIEMQRKVPKSGVKRYLCRGAKFLVAVGFIWRTLHTNGEVNFHFGKDAVTNNWVQSLVELPSKISHYRHGLTSTFTLKRVYCMAPAWNSGGEWIHVKLDTIKDS